MKLFILLSLLSTCFILSLADQCASNDAESYCFKDNIEEELETNELDDDEIINELIKVQNLAAIEPTPIHLDDPDYHAPIDKIIESRGFSFEKHFIETKDGYILGVYRLVNPFVDQSLRSKLKPLVLQHGFLGVGQDWLINSFGGDAVSCDDPSLNQDLPQNNNLGFFLANNCYDVWISNSRGNGYSRNHTTLDPDSEDKKFWRFTIDDFIAYDAPAIIDYILDKTGFSSLGWIGHSQGTMIMFGLLSERPEYSSKVKPFIALAPVFYVENLGKFIRFFSKATAIPKLRTKLVGELSHKLKILKKIDELTCYKLFCHTFYRMLGYNEKEMNQTRIDIYRYQKGSGTSLWNLFHFGQNVNSGNFTKFDYGEAENNQRYGQSKPPVYEPDTINSTSIALFHSQSDGLADPKDVDKILKGIKVPLIRNHRIPEKSWNHLDFLYAKETYKYINSEIIKILSSIYD